MFEKDPETMDETDEAIQVGTLVAVDKVKMLHVLEALNEIEQWVGSVRCVLERLDPEMLIEDAGMPVPDYGNDPKPRLDKFDCATE